MVLVAVGQGERHPHSRVFVGVNNLRGRIEQTNIGRKSCGHMVVHHGCDSRLNHLDGAIQGVQIWINVPHRPPRDNPSF